MLSKLLSNFEFCNNKMLGDRRTLIMIARKSFISSIYYTFCLFSFVSQLIDFPQFPLFSFVGFFQAYLHLIPKSKMLIIIQV